MIDVTIIVVGTNEKADLERCLPSIQGSRTSFKFETILVDNASTDGTYDWAREKFPDIKVIRTSRKEGYIANNNRAMKEGSGRYFLLLNSDIELKPDTLDYTLRFMDAHPNGAAASCKLLFDDGSLQLTARRFPTPLVYLARLPHFFRWLKFMKPLAKNAVVSRYLMMDYDHEHARQVDWCVSAFFLLRRKAIEEVGPVGQGLLQPFYLEDVDFCFRALMKGWKTYYIPEVTAFHFYKRGSVSKLGRLSFVHMGNILIFYAKNGLNMMLGRHRRAA